MPCPHYRIMISTRSKSPPTTASAAYQSGERLYDERTHRTKNYDDKRGVIYTEIMLPDNAPKEYADRNTLWNAVEWSETNWNAQMARKLHITLPRELSNESVAVTPDSSNANQATFTMPAADVAVTAEFEEAEVVLPVISNVQLLRNPDKTVLTDDVTLDEETATWTITLPSDTDQTVLDNLTMQYLKITHSGASVSQMRGTDAGHDDATLEPKWSSGNVMCNMELNTPATFTVTAADSVTKKIYTIKIVHEGADKPVLSNGSANRTSDTDATVTFTSSAAGRYYYKVVASGAAEPDNIDTGTSGTAVVGGFGREAPNIAQAHG